jgi:flagellar basal body-associated protein FliL
MTTLDQQTSPQGTGSGNRRWIAIAVVVGVVAVGVVLLVLYGGGGSAPGY